MLVPGQDMKVFPGKIFRRQSGMPGQAISYKIGERVWLQAREEAKARSIGDFNLKDWHTRALNLGGMGLAQMKRELSSI